jgi:hypothetical protein
LSQKRAKVFPGYSDRTFTIKEKPMSNKVGTFRVKCFNASDNQLITIALDEAQKAEYNENGNMHSRYAQIAVEELERRGLDVTSLFDGHDDMDFNRAL